MATYLKFLDRNPVFLAYLSHEPHIPFAEHPLILKYHAFTNNPKP